MESSVEQPSGRKTRLNGTTPMARLLPWLVLLAVVAAYSPSLPGSWIWDDWPQVARNSNLAHPLSLLLGDIRAGTDMPGTDHYRPLVMLSYVPGQWLLPGPLVERLINLALHLAAVLALAHIGLRLGASTSAAWLGAALLGLHPGASEAVAWVSGRHDLLPSLLFLWAWWAWLAGRPLLAGWLLGLAPFGKESFLLVPACALLWMLGSRRFSWSLLLPAALGPAAYLAIRHAIHLPMPSGVVGGDWGPALTAVSWRALKLAFVPMAPDALPPFVALPAPGWAFALLGLLLLFLARGRPILAGLLACLLLLVPAALASRQLGLLGDRYFYLTFAGCGAALAAARGKGRLPVAAWMLPLGLGVLTLARSSDWVSDSRLFSASMRADPGNPYAAFHLAYDLHTRQGDCQRAIPLYRVGRAVDARSGNNLQACLLNLGRYQEALEMGPALLQADPENPTPAANTARAAAALGLPDQAETYVREAIRRQPGRCHLALLLGNVLGQQGRLEEARQAFQHAQMLDASCQSGALKGLETVKRLLNQEQGQPEPGASPTRAPGSQAPQTP